MEQTRILFDTPLPPWLTALGALCLLLAGGAMLRRDLARCDRVTRWGALGCQALAAMLLLGLLLKPTWVSVRPDPRKPKCTLLVDVSRSMSLSDPYTGEAAEWLRARMTAADTDAETVPRLRAVQAALDPSASSFVARLRAATALTAEGFAGTRRQLALDGALDVAADPEGYTSPLGEVLADVARRPPADRPRAVVLISDGGWNSGRDPVEAARTLGRMGVRVYTVGVGAADPPRDAAVFDLRAPEKSLLGEELLMTAQVAATGLGPVRLAVALAQDGTVLARKVVAADPSGRPVPVNFSHVPERPGDAVFTVTVAEQPGEKDAANNVVRAKVEIVERTVRALFIESEPRWEYRFLRSVLNRDPSVELTTCLLRPGVGPARGPGFVASVPADKKALAAFDLILLGDVPRSALPEEFLKETAAMVRARSAALLVIAGRRGYYRGLKDTPLGEVLPVEWESGRGGDAAAPAPFPLHLTPFGLMHVITRLAPTPEENQATWAALPSVQWSALIERTVRGARALVEHPHRLSAADRMPLIAVHSLGGGKAMFCGVEETWRWRREVGDLHHYRFWAQAVRWLVRRQFAGGDARARLSTDRAECDVGEAVAVEAFCLGDDGFPLEGATVRLRAETDDLPAREIALEPTPGGWGVYRGTFIAAAPGRWRLRPIVSAYGDQPLASEAALTVRRTDFERFTTAQDRALLERVAEAGGGAYVPIHAADSLPDRLEAAFEKRMLRSEFSPTRHWGYYGVMALLFGAAWFLRRRGGLA